MRKVLVVAALAVTVWSCGDNRSDTGGAGNTDTASTNTTVGTGNGGHTYGGDSIGQPPGNPSGFGNDSGNKGPSGQGDTMSRSSGAQQ